ncbi:hypothetical protein [Pseudomonas phage PJNP013]|uniref:Uncharacterized protein n=1 Tax=Pseudomonas phage PJNP013 TaxID=3108093 RepID=A0ABZ2CRT1_9CAUD
MTTKSKLSWSVIQPHTPDNPTPNRIVECRREVVGGLNYARSACSPGNPEFVGRGDLRYLASVFEELTDLLMSTSRLADLRWYRAEVLSIGEWREYRAITLEQAATLAEEEFGADDIGRVIEKR